MESDQLPLIEVPHSIVPGSVPLTNRRREQYCRLRVLGISPVNAAREAGYTAGSATAKKDKTAGLRGAANKAENNQKVQDRIRFLAGNTDAVLRQKRAKIEECLWNILDAPIKRVMRTTAAITDDEGEEKRPAAVGLDTDKIAALDEEQREALFGSLKAVTFMSGGAVKLEPHSVTEAASQLRALNGLDAPKRVEMSGPEGGPIETQDVSARELIASRLARLAAPAAASGDT